jgi:hypothetical protein
MENAIAIWSFAAMCLSSATLGLCFAISHDIHQLQKGQEVTQLTHCIRVDKTHYLCQRKK